MAIYEQTNFKDFLFFNICFIYYVYSLFYKLKITQRSLLEQKLLLSV